MNEFNDKIKSVLTVGTPQCGIFSGVIGFIIALCLLLFGFWNTLFIALLCAAGVFVGGVKDKGAFVKKVINRFLPPQDKNNQ